MSQISTGDVHGLYKIFVGLVNEEGKNYGMAGLNPAAGVLLEPYELKYPKSSPLPAPDRPQIDFTGGDTYNGSYQYGITSLGTMTIEHSTVDGKLTAILSRSMLDNTTNARMLMFSENVLEPESMEVWVMIVWRIQSKQSGSFGANKYFTTIIPRAIMTPKGFNGGPSFQSATSYSYQLTLTVSDTLPWGMPVSDTAMELADDKAAWIHSITDYPLHLVGMIPEAGATEVVTLPFTPAPFNYSTPDSSEDPVQCFINGEMVNATSINATTRAVTLSPISPATAFVPATDYIGILYEVANYNRA